MMKEKICKNKLILFITLLITLTLAFSINFTAKAQNLTEPNPIQSFTTTIGAQVRIADTDANGIKFLATMNKADYESIMAKKERGEYTDVTFGVIIAPADYETEKGEFSKENLFSENSIYNWAVYNNDTGKWEYTPIEGKTRVINIQHKKMYQDTKTGLMFVYGGMYNIKADMDGGINNIQKEFTSQAYYSYTTREGVTTYELASKPNDAKDYKRSMEYVAKQAIFDEKSDLLPEQKQALQNNYVEKALKPQEEIKDYESITATVGETITLEKKIGGKILNHSATFIPDYDGGTKEENITTSTYTFTQSGSLTVTYSLLGIKGTGTQVINVDYPITEGEIFNPSNPKMINNVYSGNVTQTLVTEKTEEKIDYLSLKANHENWVVLNKITPRQDLSKYKTYNAVSMMVKFISTSDKVQIAFFNDELRTIPANKWIKIYLDKERFMNCTKDLIPWKNDPKWASGKAIKEVRVGEIKAVNNNEAKIDKNLIFKVSADTTHTYGNYAVSGDWSVNSEFKKGDTPQEKYNGNYVSFTPLADKGNVFGGGWVRINNIIPARVAQKDKPAPYQDYNYVSMWVRFASTNREINMPFLYNAKPALSRIVPANKWVNIHLPRDKFTTQTFLILLHDGGQKISEVRIGDIVAENITDTTTIFSVNSDGKTTKGDYSVDKNKFPTQTIHAASDNKDKESKYNGGYVTLQANAGWVDVRAITPYLPKDTYSKYKAVSMWVRFTSIDKDVTIKFFNNTPKTISANKWVKIYLDKDKVLNSIGDLIPWKNAIDYFGGENITELSIGDIVAESEMPTQVSLLNVDNFVIRDNNSANITDRTIDIKMVKKTETEVEYLKIDFAQALSEKEDAWWTNVYVKNLEEIKSGDFKFFKVKVRYSADRKVAIKEEDFRGIELFRKAQANTKTNEWYTATFTQKDLIDAIRNGDVHMFTAKVMVTVPGYMQGHITSIDIAEFTGYATNPNA